MNIAPPARPRMREITVGADFSATPGGRHRQDGANSAEAFREDVLVPALQAADTVTVYLDGTAGYAGSFLEEAFGGLVRVHHYSLDELRTKLTIAVHDTRYELFRKLAEKYLVDAGNVAAAKPA